MLMNLGPDGGKRAEFLAGMAIVAISVSPTDGGIWIADLLGETFQGEISKWTSGGRALFKNPIPQPSSVSVGHWAGN